jgi:hypothetical protein
MWIVEQRGTRWGNILGSRGRPSDANSYGGISRTGLLYPHSIGTDEGGSLAGLEVRCNCRRARSMAVCPAFRLSPFLIYVNDEERAGREEGSLRTTSCAERENHFLHVDPDDPKAPKPITKDMTEDEVRRYYRNAGWSVQILMNACNSFVNGSTNLKLKTGPACGLQRRHVQIIATANDAEVP